MNAVNAALAERARRLRLRCLAGFLFQLVLLVYVQVGWLGAGPWTVQILGAAVLVNAVAYGVARWAPTGTHPFASAVTPLVGLATWTSLTYLGGGVGGSLFVVGFWFEILLGGVTASVSGVVFGTLLSALCLWGLQLVIGLEDKVGSLALQTSFLVLVGGVTALLRRSWESRQERFSFELDEQQRRLERIEAKLADAQALADLGAQTARMGHGLKNAVHSLRGFSTLIERSADPDGRAGAALKGLQQAIDQLEHLALETLAPAPPTAPENKAAAPLNGTVADMASLRAIVEDSLTELRASFPDVHTSLGWSADQADSSVPRGVLTEVLGNLLRNAAEAMEGRGTIRVGVRADADGWRIDVIDDGPGIPPEREADVFRPGLSTKTQGHGMGLYIARNLMESHGGGLTLVPSGPGTAFRVTLPTAWRA